MRIVCPNCEAQYEIPDDVMPIDGRDVQCSNCDQAWFQYHPDADPPDGDGPLGKLGLQTGFPPHPAKSSATYEPEAAPKPTVSKDGPMRKTLDPEVADVLREEAEIETRARRAQQSDPLESQPDLGLEDLDTKDRSKETTEDDASPKAEAPISDALAAPAVAEGILESRRNRLPDIEEINSTLRSNSSRSPETDPGQTAQIEQHEARSSRLGFSLVVALFAVLVLAYVFAGPLAETFPPLEPMLTTYVGIVEPWRIWLDEKAASLVLWLEAAAASSTP